ncbi:zinc finger protein-like [Tropilaelaps mercedesae]|uniref:Zinc finger protein-like n=1 Tax=Tropilaelaps mercedesae TaxID=418985 RepID=A0A1V9XCV2_9ACAR|nr:zinc finger protein-like [Tropilaelaps mercedesae]
MSNTTLLPGANASSLDDSLTDAASKEGQSNSTGTDPQLYGMKSVRVGAHVAMYRGGGMGVDSSHTLYACTRSGCSFRTHSYSTNLRNHLAEHFGERPFICGECDYRSERFDSLRKHCRVHTGKSASDVGH